MAVDTSFESLFQSLKVEDPWLPPKPWESIPSESGLSRSSDSCLTSSSHLYDSSTVSEATLVRLAMNALQGVQSALASIQKLAAAFVSDPADRTFHHIPSLWSRCTSTHALGEMLKSIGCLGTIVFLLHKFVSYFTNMNFSENWSGNKQTKSEPLGYQDDYKREAGLCLPYGLVNQAFAVAIRKVLEGYICALDTLYASVGLRRMPKDIVMHLQSSLGVGCLTSMVHSEITLLELYLHTKELRTKIEFLGNICNLHDAVLCFPTRSLEDIVEKATFGFCNFPRKGDLLSYMHALLQVADPVHHAVLKFLFLRSCEPYCEFIRSWIYEAKIVDPYKEFIVEYIDFEPPPNYHSKTFISTKSLATARVHDGVPVPCFLESLSVPLFRAGQQLHVLLKLLELCSMASNDLAYEDIFPHWNEFSSDLLSCASPLTFNKEKLEAMVIARSSYYEKMLDKLNFFLRRLEIRYQQVVPHDMVPALAGSLDISASFTSNDCLESLSANRMDSNVVSSTEYCATSTITDGFHYAVDSLDSSESSSWNGSECHDDSEHCSKLPKDSAGLEESYFRALSFSTNSHSDSLQKIPRSDKLHVAQSDFPEACKQIEPVCAVVDSNHKDASLSRVSMWEPYCSFMTDPQNVEDNDLHMCFPHGGLLKNPLHLSSECYDDIKSFPPPKDVLKLKNTKIGTLKHGVSYFTNMVADKYSLTEEGADSDSDQLESDALFSSLRKDALSRPLSWKLKYYSNLFSTNPMLTKNSLSLLVGKPGKRFSTNYNESFSCFDFLSVEDPCKVYLEKLASSSEHVLESESKLITDSNASTRSVRSNCREHQSRGSNDESTVEKKTYASSLGSKNHSQNVNLTDVGGSNWESLLASFRSTGNSSRQDCWKTSAAMYEMPLDSIIDKCLLQEIMLQYKYISKLTIRLLEEGFDLQEHFLALRRYHFMEVADWASLFIRSLWNHTWNLMEADQRLSEVQVLLQSSIQRSSCGKDHNKERLFVYMDGNKATPFSSSSIGVHTFDALCLGYRVDWPVSIILTPDALKRYAEIFRFLVQVKLAAVALTDVWCSLKEAMHVSSRRHYCEHRHHHKLHNFHILSKIRLHLNHFVSTIQQYLLSELAYVSWCRFRQSFKYKVRDMMDIESVHMAYLADSLDICFLSDANKSVASIIESILQCALDFCSCVVGGTRKYGPDQKDMFVGLSHVNISQVLAIKDRFNKNLKNLHLYHLKSPINQKLRLSRFWSYLNYNEFFSDTLSL